MKISFWVLLLAGVSHAANFGLPLDKAKGETRFLAIGKPGFVKVAGKAAYGEKSETTGPLSGKLNLQDGKLAGKATFSLAAFSTGIELRDSHMKEKYLEVPKFPDAEIEFKDVPLQGAPNGKPSPFQGVLTLHGVTRPVSGVLNLKKTGNIFDLHFAFDLALPDFQITTPSYLGVTIANRVEVQVDVMVEAADVLARFSRPDEELGH